MVRQRSKTGQGKTKRCLSRKDSTGSLVENPTGKEEGKVEIPVPISIPALDSRVASVVVFTPTLSVFPRRRNPISGHMPTSTGSWVSCTRHCRVQLTLI